MTDLLLQPTGSPTQYEVIADAQIVGRITLSSSLRNHSEPWVWWSARPCGHERGCNAGVRAKLVRREPTVTARLPTEAGTLAEILSRSDSITSLRPAKVMTTPLAPGRGRPRIPTTPGPFRLWGNQMVLAALSGRLSFPAHPKPANAKAPAMQHLLGAFL